ncbi:hypothetical protein [Oceanobacillus salinisoli]|uniref:hypothetical protein n=1 Tax=Oceanobacillus salinisoli TaxID=2678611 RepID=UPI0012E2E385|nr:hypothetical protein [Oceanobacillus salinisoli]
MLQKNIIGNILFYSGLIVIITGVISAYLNANYVSYSGPYGEEEMTFEWRFFFQSATQSIFNGMILIAFSEFIKLLDGWKNKKIQVNMPATPSSDYSNALEMKPEEKLEAWSISEADQKKIYELYADQAILEITASDWKGYCIVKLQDYDGPLSPNLKVVDVRNASAEEVHHPEIIQKLLSSYRNA